MIRTRHLAFVVLGLVACQHTPQAPQETPTPPTPEVRSPAYTIWRVTADGKPGVVYLMGTAHYQRAGTSLPEEIQALLPSIDTIAVERTNEGADLEESRAYFAANGYLPEDASPNDIFGADEVIDVVRACTLANIGADWCLKAKPAWLVLTLQPAFLALASFEAASGSEELLKKESGAVPREGGVPEGGTSQAPKPSGNAPPTKQPKLVALETPEQSVGRLLSAPIAEQAGWLRLVLSALNGDSAGGPSTEASLRSFNEALLTSRNGNLADQMYKLLDDKGQAIAAVGGLHLYGDGSVLEHLERPDVRIEAIPTAEVNELLSILTPMVFDDEGEDGTAADAFLLDGISEKPLAAESYSSAEVVRVGRGSVVLPEPLHRADRKPGENWDAFLGTGTRFGVRYSVFHADFHIRDYFPADTHEAVRLAVLDGRYARFLGRCRVRPEDLPQVLPLDLSPVRCPAKYSATESRFQAFFDGKKSLTVLVGKVVRPAKSAAEEEQRAIEMDRFFNSYVANDDAAESVLDGIWVSDRQLTTEGLSRFRHWPGSTNVTERPK